MPVIGIWALRTPLRRGFLMNVNYPEDNAGAAHLSSNRVSSSWDWAIASRCSRQSIKCLLRQGHKRRPGHLCAAVCEVYSHILGRVGSSKHVNRNTFLGRPACPGTGEDQGIRRPLPDPALPARQRDGQSDYKKPPENHLVVSRKPFWQVDIEVIASIIGVASGHAG